MRSLLILLVVAAIAIATVTFTITARGAHAQSSTNGTMVNLTNYFDQHKEFQHCFSFTLPGESGPKCIPATDVLFQTPHTLALTSTYVDAIWKAVDFAKTLGYHVDGITSYITKSSSDLPGSVNILVSMSR